MRGYAPTEVPADGRYQSGVLVSDANALHEALGGDERAVIIGHDWGAFAAYGAPNVAPDRWTRVVVASVPPISVSPRCCCPTTRSSTTSGTSSCSAIRCRTRFADERLRVPRRIWADWSPGLDASEAIVPVKAALADQRQPQRSSELLPAHARWPAQRPALNAEQAPACNCPRSHAVSPRRRRRMHAHARRATCSSRPSPHRDRGSNSSPMPATSCNTSNPLVLPKSIMDFLSS